jgi:acetoin utilization deacetylase AcuC-like enzyme
MIVTPTAVSPRIIYSPRYNIGLFGLERLHPFDSRKYGRAWNVLRSRCGNELKQAWVKPSRPVSQTELLRVHTEDYLRKLRDPAFVASVLEIRQIRYLPGRLVDRLVLRPMRWATMGTIVACQEATEHGLAVNLSGGYHRAGEVKFAIYNAGTDIYTGDRLGGMNVSAEGVLKRDRFVLEELIGRRIPTAVLLSGGYSRESYRLVAEMVAFILETWGK